MVFGSPALRAALVAFATGLIGADIEAEVVDLFGVEQVTLAWAPASGPVAGYYVIVHRSGQPAAVEGMVTQTTAQISADFGDELSVSVAAFDASGIAGPVSLRSDRLRFHRDGDPTPPPPSDDPPPDPGEPLPAEGPGTPLDFTGDGVSDLLLRDPSGALGLVAMEGAVPVAAWTLLSPDASWSVVGTGDYDGNGLADVLWQQDMTGFLVASRMYVGRVGQGAAVDFQPRPPEDGWRVGTSGDFDGDGDDDVLLFSRVLGEAEILHLHDGKLAARSRRPGYAGAWSVATAGDVDGDGIDEIVWRDEVGQSLVLWQPEIGGLEGAIDLAAPVGDRRIAGAGDFDGDGREDLFLTGADPRQLEIWRLDGRTVDVAEIPHELAGTWRTAGVGDYDADGRADLSWFDPETRGVEIWFSDGSGVTQEVVPGGVGAFDLVSGNDGSDDSAFRARLCDGDLNEDGGVDWLDLSFFQSCFAASPEGGCEQTDIDGDGVIGMSDLTLLVQVFDGPSCAE